MPGSGPLYETVKSLQASVMTKLKNASEAAKQAAAAEDQVADCPVSVAVSLSN